MDRGHWQATVHGVAKSWTCLKPLSLCVFVVCVAVKYIQSCLILWTSWTVTHQAPLSMEFSRQEY